MEESTNSGRALRRPGWQAALVALCAGLVVVGAADKVVGLTQAPLAAFLAAYVSGCGATLLAPSRRAARRVAVILALTMGVILAWRFASDPTSLLLWRQLHAGDALLEAGKREDALLVYRAAERKAPRSPHVLTRLGAAYYRITDYPRAARAYETALRQAAPALDRNRRWRVLVDLGQTYWKLKRHREALAAYLEAETLGIPPEERMLMDYRLAGVHFDLRDFYRSIDHYGRVAAAKGKYEAASLYNIACAYAQKYGQAPARERPALVRRAVESLRVAWARANDPEDRQALLEGLVGGPEEQDPELEPLRGTPELEALLRGIRAQQRPERRPARRSSQGTDRGFVPVG